MVHHIVREGFSHSYKPHNKLKIFSESVADYANWASRATDPIARHHHGWKDILTNIKSPGETRISKSDLVNYHCDGVDAWVLAKKLEAWIADWFSTNLYNRRIQLAGGKTVKKVVVLRCGDDYTDSTLAPHKLSNLEVSFDLQAMPKCTAMSKLEAHLEGWQGCLDEYGTDTYAAPNMLRTMLIGTLPD